MFDGVEKINMIVEAFLQAVFAYGVKGVCGHDENFGMGLFVGAQFIERLYRFDLGFGVQNDHVPTHIQFDAGDEQDPSFSRVFLEFISDYHTIVASECDHLKAQLMSAIERIKTGVSNVIPGISLDVDVQ